MRQNDNVAMKRGTWGVCMRGQGVRIRTERFSVVLFIACAPETRIGEPVAFQLFANNE